jgi:hypothetical protein
LKGTIIGKVFYHGIHHGKKQSTQKHIENSLVIFQSKILAKMANFTDIRNLFNSFTIYKINSSFHCYYKPLFPIGVLLFQSLWGAPCYWALANQASKDWL